MVLFNIQMLPCIFLYHFCISIKTQTTLFRVAKVAFLYDVFFIRPDIIVCRVKPLSAREMHYI